MDLGLAGRAALVGGGSRGLGRAAAEALAREGAQVAIYARDAAALRRTAAELAAGTDARVLPLPGDVARPGEAERLVERAAEELGRLDVLVTNMGGPPYGAAAERSDEEWQRAWELVTLSVIRLCRAAVPHMPAGASIVNVTTPGVAQIIPTTALSTVARMATTGFARYLAAELGARDVRVNNVQPGWIETQRVVELAEAEAAERGVPVADVYAEQAAAIPLGRFGRPDEVAATIAFLASARASYITGTDVRVDGGWATATGF